MLVTTAEGPWWAGEGSVDFTSLHGDCCFDVCSDSPQASRQLVLCVQFANWARNILLTTLQSTNNLFGVLL